MGSHEHVEKCNDFELCNATLGTTEKILSCIDAFKKFMFISNLLLKMYSGM